MKTRIVSIASGKGGVGKTNLALNLALAIGQSGKSVCLFDADLGLSNVDILLGVEPQQTLEDILFSGARVEDCLLPIRPGVHLLAGSSGVARMASLDKRQRALLGDELAKLTRFDYLLVDNSPGIIPPVISLCLSSRDLVVLATPEAASITDAYALIKVLKGNGLWWSPLVLVNRARSARHAEAVFSRLRDTAHKHLQVRCLPLGWLPEDPAVARASLLREPVLESAPQAPFCRGVRRAARLLVGHTGRKDRIASPEAFWEQSITRLQAVAPPSGNGAAAAQPGLAARAARALEELDAARVLLGEAAASRRQPRRVLRHLEPCHRLLAELAGNAAGEAPPDRKEMTTGESRAAEAGPPAALVLCHEAGLREVLVDLALEAGFAPVQQQEDAAVPPALVVLSLDRGVGPAAAPWLAPDAGAPVLALKGHGALWTAPLPSHVTLLQKPFSVQEFIATARRLATAGSGGA